MLVPVKALPSLAVKWMTDTYGLTVSMVAWADTLLHETPMKANRKRTTAATTSKNITLGLLELLGFMADYPLPKHIFLAAFCQVTTLESLAQSTKKILPSDLKSNYGY